MAPFPPGYACVWKWIRGSLPAGSTSSSSFERVFIHCCAAIDLGAGVDQSFDCLSLQSGHAIHEVVGGLDSGG